MERRGQEGAVLASTDSNRINDKIRGAELLSTRSLRKAFREDSLQE